MVEHFIGNEEVHEFDSHHQLHSHKLTALGWCCKFFYIQNPTVINLKCPIPSFQKIGNFMSKQYKNAPIKGLFAKGVKKTVHTTYKPELGTNRNLCISPFS